MNQPFFVYMLRCNDGTYYLGQTDNLNHRIAEHQHGEGCEYTQSRLPVELVWSQEFDDRALREFRSLKPQGTRALTPSDVSKDGLAQRKKRSSQRGLI